MKDILQDLIAHTHALGFIPLVKVSSINSETVIEARADDLSVNVFGKTNNPIEGFDGVFGMPNLNKLDIHLKCPEYKENAQITIETEDRDGVEEPAGLHFVNETGDFRNYYRFMSSIVVNSKLKSVKFKDNGPTWVIEFNPSQNSIQRLKFQQSAHSEETVVKVKSDNGNLVFSFGDANTHAGSFVFESGISGSLKQPMSWPISQLISILSLPGDMSIKIAENPGAMMITVNSGLAEYNYVLPAHTK